MKTWNQFPIKTLALGLAVATTLALPQTSIAGGSRGGGTNGLNGRPLDADGLRSHQMKGYREFEQTLGQIGRHLPDLAIFMQRRADNLKWYRVAVQLPNLPANVIGLSVISSGRIHQIARLEDPNTVFVNNTALQRMDARAASAMILHEVILSTYMRMREIAEARAMNRGSIRAATREELDGVLTDVFTMNQAGGPSASTLSEDSLTALFHTRTRNLTVLFMNLRENEESRNLQYRVRQDSFGHWETGDLYDPEMLRDVRRATYGMARELNPLCVDGRMSDYVRASVRGGLRLNSGERALRPIEQMVVDFLPAQNAFWSSCRNCSEYSLNLAAAQLSLEPTPSRVLFPEFMPARNEQQNVTGVHQDNPFRAIINTTGQNHDSMIFVDAHGVERYNPLMYTATRVTCQRISEIITTRGASLPALRPSGRPAFTPGEVMSINNFLSMIQ